MLSYLIFDFLIIGPLLSFEYSYTVEGGHNLPDSTPIICFFQIQTRHNGVSLLGPSTFLYLNIVVNIDLSIVFLKIVNRNQLLFHPTEPSSILRGCYYHRFVLVLLTITP